MYKDKNGIEYKKYTDICFQDDEVICPCCGYTKNKYILNEIIEMFGLDIKCSKCGCVFLVMPKIKFEIRCRNYRTDGKDGERKNPRAYCGT